MEKGRRIKDELYLVYFILKELEEKLTQANEATENYHRRYSEADKVSLVDQQVIRVFCRLVVHDLMSCFPLGNSVSSSVTSA